MSGLHRSMSGEVTLLLGQGEGFVEFFSFGLLFADQFQGKKGGVSFVHVEE